MFASSIDALSGGVPSTCAGTCGDVTRITLKPRLPTYPVLQRIHCGSCGWRAVARIAASGETT